MYNEPIKLDPPGTVVLMTKNGRGEPRIRRVKADLVHLPDPNRLDDLFWAEIKNTMVAWEPEDTFFEIL